MRAHTYTQHISPLGGGDEEEEERRGEETRKQIWTNILHEEEEEEEEEEEVEEETNAKYFFTWEMRGDLSEFFLKTSLSLDGLRDPSSTCSR